MEEHRFEQFEAYLEATATEEQRKELERELKAKPNLQLEFEEFRTLWLGIQAVFLKDELDDIHQDLMLDQAKVVPFWRKRSWTIAAILLVLIASAILFFPKESSSKDIYASIHQVDPGLPSLMGLADKPEFDKAMLSFKKGEYTLALETFISLEEAGGQNDTLSFYQAMSMMELERMGDAQASLDQLLTSDSDFIRYKAEWYVFQIQVFEGNYPIAGEWLKKISSNEDHPFRQKAIEIQDEFRFPN
ncbi:MAG: hypothetical protein AAFY71_10025 [Bacteroidota bacterium]